VGPRKNARCSPHLGVLNIQEEFSKSRGFKVAFFVLTRKRSSTSGEDGVRRGRERGFKDQDSLSTARGGQKGAGTREVLLGLEKQEVKTLKNIGHRQ